MFMQGGYHKLQMRPIMRYCEPNLVTAANKKDLLHILSYYQQYCKASASS